MSLGIRSYLSGVSAPNRVAAGYLATGSSQKPSRNLDTLEIFIRGATTNRPFVFTALLFTKHHFCYNMGNLDIVH